MSKIKPLFDYVLIEPLEKETTLPSGIVIPDSAKEKPQEGKVIAVGSGRPVDDPVTIAASNKPLLRPLTVKVGDVVMYKKWGGTEVKVDGKDHLLIKEEDLLAIVE